MRYPLSLDLRPSGRIQTLMFAMHGIAASALLFSTFSPLLRSTLLAGVLLSLCFGMWRQRLRAERVLVLGADGLLEMGEGGKARVLAATTDFGWAVWLCWESGDGGRRALMLAPDSMPAGAWRRLRIWLRHKAGHEPAVPAGGA